MGYGKRKVYDTNLSILFYTEMSMISQRFTNDMILLLTKQGFKVYLTLPLKNKKIRLVGY